MPTFNQAPGASADSSDVVAGAQAKLSPEELDSKYMANKESTSRTDHYQIGDAVVKIGNGEGGRIDVSKGENGNTFIEIPVSINSPTAPGDFKNVDRWSKYEITMNAEGEVIWASRVDRSFNESTQSYEYKGGRYQIHDDEVEKLLSTAPVFEAVKNSSLYKNGNQGNNEQQVSVLDRKREVLDRDSTLLTNDEFEKRYGISKEDYQAHRENKTFMHDMIVIGIN